MARSDGQPDDEQKSTASAARARGENEDRNREFDEGDQGQESAAERERFHGFGFEHAAEQLAGALMANAVRFQAQSAEEEPLLEARSRADRDPALQPGDQDAKGNQREQQESPEP